ncbi:MAG: hypothetical protein Phog2KO_48570 [Phototrophicaceae bacterium]
MQKIGTVAFVQVQRYSMKKVINDDLHYDTSPLLLVDKLWLNDKGIIGITSDNTSIIDVHSQQHPESKYRGDNKISIGFLSNYKVMRERFGEHMVDGIAGESILINLDTDLPDDILEKEWILENSEGQQIKLKSVIVAPPCREFSIFCAQETIAGAELKSTLQFLHNGRRGYYMELADTDMTYYVQAGDSLYIM